MSSAPASSLRVLIFPLKNLFLALRLDWVIKVIPLPEIFSAAQRGMGVAHFENREITILDPYQKLYGEPNPTPCHYMIVVGTHLPQEYGIPVTTLPQIRELALANVRQLPPAYRQGDTLGIASHVALLPEADQTRTLFLLDLEALCQRMAGIGQLPAGDRHNP